MNECGSEGVRVYIARQRSVLAILITISGRPFKVKIYSHLANKSDTNRAVAPP